ncbi:MAG: DUF1573 domain-containing protein [Fuerstiella sp.]
MKNLILILLFVGVVIGGGVWLTSNGAGETSIEPENATVTPAAANSEETPRPRPASKGPHPKAVTGERHHEFGSMVVGAELEHVFEISNEGAADLELLEGQPTCKCTQFKLSQRRLKPGEKATLTIRWIGKFKDSAFEHGGEVYTNDPDRTEIMFRVAGVVDDAVELLPSGTWHLTADSDDRGGSMSGIIVSRVYQDFQITELNCDSPWIDSTFEPIAEDQYESLGVLPGVLTAYRITVSLKPDAPPGLLSGRMTIGMDCMDESYTVQISAKKSGPIRILPPAGVAFSEEKNGLALGRFPSTKGREITLSLLVDSSEMTEPLQLTSIDAQPAFIAAELHPGTDVGESRQRYKLTIRIPPGIPRSSRDGSNPARLSMETNHPSGQAIQLLLSYTVF